MQRERMTSNGARPGHVAEMIVTVESEGVDMA